MTRPQVQYWFASRKIESRGERMSDCGRRHAAFHEA